jgi:hypothetical protein
MLGAKYSTLGRSFGGFGSIPRAAVGLWLADAGAFLRAQECQRHLRAFRAPVVFTYNRSTLWAHGQTIPGLKPKPGAPSDLGAEGPLILWALCGASR